MYKLLFSKVAEKDAAKLKSANLAGKCQKLFEIIARNPFENPPSFEKLTGNLSGFCSRRMFSFIT